MKQIMSQCSNCGAFTRRSRHHEEEYRSSVLLERLRTSNFPATDQEITHIRHTILPTVSDDISLLDSKLASLQKVIRSMEKERKRLMNVQKKYSNLISLHRTLPSEIWSEIFLHTLSGYFDPDAFDASGSIWRLSHVCQRWRNVALSLQSFWSTMDIRFPEILQREADVQRLEAVLQRSRHGLLDLSLSDGSDEDDGQTFVFDSLISKRILDIIVAESHRWRKAQLSFSRANWDVFYAPLHNRLPRLEAVGIYFDPLAPEEQSPVSVFKHCPRLTALTLSGVMRDVDFPWDQITELDLSGMDLEADEEKHRACMHLIERCPLLEILSTPFWDLEDDDEAESPDNIPTTYSNALKLKAQSVPDPLTLPLLREASLHPNPAFNQYDSLYSLKCLLIRSNRMNGLTSLSLASVPLAASPDRTLHSLLSQTHSLTSFKLSVNVQEYSDQTDISDRNQIMLLVNSLEVIPTKAITFLPRLSALHIRVYNHRNSWSVPYFGPIGAFASAVKARWKGNNTIGLARLRTCHFSVQAHHLRDQIYRGSGASNVVPDIFDEAERFTFNGLVDDGMDLNVRITSGMTRNVGSNGVVFAVSR